MATHIVANQEDQWGLFSLSLSILFLEMACIRWLNASIPILAYFNNLILVTCFFGLGVGCLLTKRRRLLPFLPLAFTALVAMVRLSARWRIEVSYSGDYLFGASSGDVVQLPYAALLAPNR